MAASLFRALYTDDDILMGAVKKLREERYHIEEVYTPFPVHGLDKAMGLEDTRISITAFMYGCLGLTVAVVMMNYIMIDDWPQDIGGKPSFSYFQNMPAFVPVMFEMTVFFAAPISLRLERSSESNAAARAMVKTGSRFITMAARAGPIRRTPRNIAKKATAKPRPSPTPRPEPSS